MPVSPMSYHTQWLGRAVLLPSGRRGVVMGWTYDRLTVEYLDNGDVVTIHPNLVEVTDGSRPAE